MVLQLQVHCVNLGDKYLSHVHPLSSQPTIYLLLCDLLPGAQRLMGRPSY